MSGSVDVTADFDLLDASAPIFFLAFLNFLISPATLFSGNSLNLCCQPDVFSGFHWGRTSLYNPIPFDKVGDFILNEFTSFMKLNTGMSREEVDLMLDLYNNLLTLANNNFGVTEANQEDFSFYFFSSTFDPRTKLVIHKIYSIIYDTEREVLNSQKQESSFPFNMHEQLTLYSLICFTPGQDMFFLENAYPANSGTLKHSVRSALVLAYINSLVPSWEFVTKLSQPLIDGWQFALPSANLPIAGAKKLFAESVEAFVSSGYIIEFGPLKVALKEECEKHFISYPQNRCELQV